MPATANFQTCRSASRLGAGLHHSTNHYPTVHYLTIYILGLLIIASCTNPKRKEAIVMDQFETEPTYNPDIPNVAEKEYHGIKIINTGPRGGGYINMYGEDVGYRIFRVQVFNDTIVPVEMQIDFPSQPVSLLPDSAIQVMVCLIPDSLTPDTILNQYNFGITNIENFFESKIKTPPTLRTSIEPDEYQVLYIGIRFNSPVEKGVTRSKLFLNGQKIDNSFLPVTGIQTTELNSASLDLTYGIGVDPPNYYTLIPCGKVLFK